MLARVVVVSSWLLLGGCGGSGSSSTKDAGPTATTPLAHRPSAVACPPLTGTCGAGGDMGSCSVDGECVSGLDGHCDSSAAGCSCDYSACLADSDCPGESVCDCYADTSPGSSTGNRCSVGGNCRVDSDCGSGGYCSPSRGEGCTPPLGLTGYFCHTKTDSCINDSDCPPSSAGVAACRYDATVGHWACSSIACAG